MYQVGCYSFNLAAYCFGYVVLNVYVLLFIFCHFYFTVNSSILAQVIGGV